MPWNLVIYLLGTLLVVVEFGAVGGLGLSLLALFVRPEGKF